MKRWLQQDKKEQRVQSIKEELLRGFELLPEAESDYLVAQLSGYQQTGKVPQQLTSHKTVLEQRLWHTQAVHHLLQLIMYGGNYPFTNACMAVSRKKSKPKYARNPTIVNGRQDASRNC